MSTRTARPFFLWLAVCHLTLIASLFPEIAARLPVGAADWGILVIGPLWALAGFIEGRLQYPAEVDLPLWMRIRDRPIKAAIGLAGVHLAVVLVSRLGIKFRGIDPFGPSTWPLTQRALFFAGLTIGMSFVFYIAATRTLVPFLRLLTRPARWLPRPLGLPVALAVGAALGVALLLLVRKTLPGDALPVLEGLVAVEPGVMAAAGGMVAVSAALALVLPDR